MNSIWWLGLIFFFDLFSHSGLRAFFTSDFANCTTNYAPHQVLSKYLIFFFDLFSHSGLRASGAVMPQQHSWWLGLFFFDLFSHSGLRPFFTSDFANCTTNYAPALKITPTIRCCEQHLMVGFNFFFDLCSHCGLRAFFTSDFVKCTTNYASPY